MISPDLPALVVNTGDPVALHCSGESEVVWKSRKDTLSNHTSSTLSIPKATYRDTGTYKCAYVNSSDTGIATVHLFVRGNRASLSPRGLAEEPPFREHSHHTGPLCGCGCVCVWGSSTGYCEGSGSLATMEVHIQWGPWLKHWGRVQKIYILCISLKGLDLSLHFHWLPSQKNQ